MMVTMLVGIFVDKPARMSNRQLNSVDFTFELFRLTKWCLVEYYCILALAVSNVMVHYYTKDQR